MDLWKPGIWNLIRLECLIPPGVLLARLLRPCCLRNFGCRGAGTSDIFEYLNTTLRRRIMMIDGAMGTMIQKHRLGEEDYRGERFKDYHRDLKGDNDLLSLTQVRALGASSLGSRLARGPSPAGSDAAMTSLPAGCGLAERSLPYNILCSRPSSRPFIWAT